MFDQEAKFKDQMLMELVSGFTTGGMPDNVKIKKLCNLIALLHPEISERDLCELLDLAEINLWHSATRDQLNHSIAIYAMSGFLTVRDQRGQLPLGIIELTENITFDDQYALEQARFRASLDQMNAELKDYIVSNN